MLKSGNFIVIQDWMRKEPYNLTGNDLIVFAVIYGLSQIDAHCFYGSLSFLSEWTGASRAGIIKNLNNLISRGLIRKEVSKPTNKYFVTNPQHVYKDENLVEEDVNKVEEDVNKVDTDPKLSSHNNIINTNNNINIYSEKRKNYDLIERIISYLNTKCNTSYKASTKATQKLVMARIKEGFTEADFKMVIDTKYNEWGLKPVRFSNGELSVNYLRPTTLFGDKFETYLHEANKVCFSPTMCYNSVSAPVDSERSNLTF